MQKTEIIPLYFGKFENFSKNRFTMTKDAGVFMDVAILAYLIKYKNEYILVDSGTPEPAVAENKDHREIKDGRSITDILSEHCLKPEDIKTIILTHLHWDHAYNLQYFAHAKIYVQLSELQYAVHPLWMHLGPYGYSKQNGNPCWFDGFNSMEIVNGDYVLNQDIQVLHLPGHTPGMQGVLVNTEEGKYLIASDNIPLYDSFDSVCPPEVHVSVADWYESYLKIKALSDFVLPGHDMKVLARCSYGVKNV